MSRPSSIIQVTSLPVSDIHFSLNKENTSSTYLETFGKILSDTKYVWICNGSNLTIVNSKTGSKTASWTFGAIVKDDSTRIVCVEELHRANGKFPLLVIGLECDSSRGCVCIFDITESRVLRAIQIADKVTSLHVINTNQDGCPLPGPLRAFDGILAIGTAGGNVLLLDLYKQLYEEILTGNATDIRDEINNCETKIVLPEEVPSLELFKRAAIKSGEHLSVHLNATLNENVPHFILKGPKGENRIYVNKVEVTVSALHYCPQLGSLLVGYNFGAWQLWNLMTLQLVYTSEIYESNIPVTHFAIQEPSDDPRSFFYIWAAYSNTMPYQTGFPVAILYSLVYSAKEWHEGYGILYQDLLSCTVKFQQNLTLFEGDSDKIAHGAYCLRLQTIHKVISKENSSHDYTEESISLCVFIWNEWKSKSSAISVNKTFIKLFDLNQWYKEQMPNLSNCKEYDTCMTNICLNDLMDDVNSEKLSFLDVFINQNTLSQFIGIQKLEEHYYPSSLAFEMCSLREKDVIFFNNQGSQRSILAHLECGGPLSLVKPTQLYHQCIDVGLLPMFMEIHLDTSMTYEFQREVLLSVALEQQLIGWLCRCASSWSNGSYSASGVTLHFLLDWGWKRALVLKQQANTLSIPLFDYSGVRLDTNTHNLLISCTKQLNSLTTLFEFIFKKFAVHLINKGVVKQQLQSLQMVSVHLEVLQWLLNVGLLPECPLSSYPQQDECNRISAPYPINNLLDYYKERRAVLQNLTRDLFSENDSLLFIDNLISLECGGKYLQIHWEQDGGTGAYPPPSLQALLRTYLVDRVEISMKHCLVVYIFLDMAMTLDKSRYDAITTHLIKFPAVFQLSPSLIKITQAFWQLDHGDFVTAMEQLLDSLVCVQDLKIWHHRIALRALLAQDQYKHALSYLQVRKPPVTEVNDLCVVLSVYIANYMLEEAFHFQRQNKGNSFETRLLRHFFRECDKNGKITSVVYLPLNNREENVFMNYLHESKHPKAENLQTFFYVRNSRFLDAYNANKKFNSSKSSQQGLDGMAQNSVADIMVKGFMNTLPEISKNLIDVYHNDKNLWKRVSRPEPFSVYIHKVEKDANYKSSLFHTVITKTKEIWNHPILDTTSENNDSEPMSNSTNFENLPFLCVPKAKSSTTLPTTPLIFPNVIMHSPKSPIGYEEEYGPTPPKKFKPTPDSLQRFSVTTKISDDESGTLVTPIIKRRLFDKSGSSQVACDLFSVKTPQSILKMHNTPQKATKVNFAYETPTVIKRTFNDEVTPVSKPWNLTSRSSIGHTPRPAVRFNISNDESDSSSDDGNVSKGEVSEVVAIIHEPKAKKLSFASEAIENSSASTSFSTNSLYSTNTTMESDVEMEICSETNTNDKLPTLRRAIKRRIDTSAELNNVMNNKLTSSPPKRPISRSSYRKSTSLSCTEEDNSSKQSSSASATSSSYKTAEQSSVIMEVSSPIISFPSSLDSSINSLSHVTENSESSKSTSIASTSTPNLSKLKLKGRRSLSRQVLENNAFMTLAESTAHIVPKTLKEESKLESRSSSTSNSCNSSSRESADAFICSPQSQKLEISLPPFSSLLEPDQNISEPKFSPSTSKTVITSRRVDETVETSQTSILIEETNNEQIVSSTSKVEVETNRLSPDFSLTNLEFPSLLEPTLIAENEKYELENNDVVCVQDEEVDIYEDLSNDNQVDEDYEIKNDVNLNSYANLSDEDEIITSTTKNDANNDVVIVDDEEEKFSESSQSSSNNLESEVIELEDSNKSDSSSYEGFDEDLIQHTDDSNTKSTYDPCSNDDSRSKSEQCGRIDEVIVLDIIPEEAELKIVNNNEVETSKTDGLIDEKIILSDDVLVETITTISSSSLDGNTESVTENNKMDIPMEEYENPQNDLVIKENLEKAVTMPARRSKRLSSLQLSTPDQTSLTKRTTRKSLSISGDVTPKAATPRTRRASSSAEIITCTPTSVRRSSTSIEVKEPTKRASRKKSTTSEDKTETKLPLKRSTRKQSIKSTSKSEPAFNNTNTTLETYSTSRRLTRRQASLLEKSLSTTSANRNTLELEESNNLDSESEESDIEHRGPQIGEIDPIHLLDKTNFTGNPDPDEEIHNSPTSSIPGSPVSSTTRRTRRTSTHSNTSLTSDVSTSSRKKKTAVKKIACAIPLRKQYRSKSIDVALINTSTVENTSTPLRRTRQNSKDEPSTSASADINDRKKIVPVRRTRATSLTLEENTPVRRSERRMNLIKPELTQITEEQSNEGEVKERRKRK